MAGSLAGFREQFTWPLNSPALRVESPIPATGQGDVPALAAYPDGVKKEAAYSAASSVESVTLVSYSIVSLQDLSRARHRDVVAHVIVRQHWWCVRHVGELINRRNHNL